MYLEEVGGPRLLLVVARVHEAHAPPQAGHGHVDGERGRLRGAHQAARRAVPLDGADGDGPEAAVLAWADVHSHALGDDPLRHEPADHRPDVRQVEELVHLGGGEAIGFSILVSLCLA